MHKSVNGNECSFLCDDVGKNTPEAISLFDLVKSAPFLILLFRHLTADSRYQTLNCAVSLYS